MTTLGWLLLTTLAVAAPQPAERHLDCVLRGADPAWNTGPEDVSAVRCEGVDGVFVPSSVYRSLRRPQDSEPYRLLNRELELSRSESLELRSAQAATDRVAKANLEVARIWEDGWKAAQASLEKDAVQVANDRQQLADERARAWSPGTWFAIGWGAGTLATLGAVGLGAYLASKD